METSNKLESFSWLSPRTASDTSYQENKQIYRRYFKRVLDLTLAFILLPLLLPILAVLIAWVKLDSKGPAIYRSQRVGKNGKVFECLKLRTMHVDADQKLASILKKNQAMQKEYQTFRKLKQDPRITSAGKLLRKFSLDELPQIFNVLKREMSFIGPRPALEDEMKPYYGEQQQNYESVLPGITGLWQVSGRNETTFSERVKLDSLYALQHNLTMDIKILFKTFPCVFSKKGAY